MWISLGLVACSGGGGSSSGGSGSTSKPAAATVIDLPPGQTSARLGWKPSVGTPDYYRVMESRNGGVFIARADVEEPSYLVRAKAGETVQIVVFAVGKNSAASPGSDPSPILRFRAAEPEPVAAATSRSQSPGLQATATQAIPATNESASTGGDGEAATTGDPDADSASETLAAESTESDASTVVLSTALRDLLLRAPLRIPVLGRADHVSAWLDAHAEEQLAAGVTLAGAGRRDNDRWAELIWQDAAGQLFVSDGATLVDASEISETLEVAIRLHATERFVALADFDGDGLGDWLIEDLATGDVWKVDGATGETHSALAGTGEPTDSRLAGTGDFDGDGRSELLWQRPDGSLTGADPAREGGAPRVPELPPMATENLLAIADLNGDGCDDLVARDAQGRLELILVVPNGIDAPTTQTLAGPTIGTGAIDLVASVDLDADGRAELVWLDADDTLEIWNALDGPIPSDASGG